MTKIKNIEFLRIVGCLAIILRHLFNNAKLHGIFADINLYDHLFKMTCNGQKAVDLFFILSGVFFVITLNLKTSMWDFIKKKLIRLYPVLIFGFILYFIASITGYMKFSFYDNILSFFMLSGTGMVLQVKNMGAFWYVSSMFWVLLLLFYLLKNYERKNVNLFVALSVFLVYSILIQAKGGKINNHEQTFYYIFNVGMMRAIGGIGLGYFIGAWYKENIQKIKEIKFSLSKKLCVTGLEFICLFFIINNLCFHKFKFYNHMVFILAFVVIITLFLLNKGYISRMLSKDIWVNLAKYTYSLYMMHIFVYDLLKNTIWTYHKDFVYAHPVVNILIALSGALILGVATYHFVEVPAAQWLKQKFKQPETAQNSTISGWG